MSSSYAITPGGGAAEEPIAVRLAKADPAKGADVFKKCAACHTINQGGANGIGETAEVDSSGAIETRGHDSIGILAQSIGEALTELRSSPRTTGRR